MKTTLGLTIALLISGAAAVAADVAGDWKLDGSIGQFPLDIVCSLKEVHVERAAYWRERENRQP
jgi:hypothetical protein